MKTRFVLFFLLAIASSCVNEDEVATETATDSSATGQASNLATGADSVLALNQPSLLVRGPGGRMMAISPEGMESGPEGRPGQFIHSWNGFAVMRDQEVLSWGSTGLKARFSFKEYVQNRTRHWALTQNGEYAVAGTSDGVHLLQRSGKHELIAAGSFQFRDDREFSLTDVGLGSGLALSEDGKKLLLAVASPDQVEDNTSRKPLADIFLYDRSDGSLRFVRAGSTPSWLSETLAIILELVPDEHYGLPSLHVVRVSDGSVLKTLSDVIGYGIVADGFFALYDQGTKVKLEFYGTDLKSTAQRLVTKPEGAIMDVRQYGYGPISPTDGWPPN